MSTRRFLALLLFVFPCVGFAITALDIRIGTWEVVMSTKIVGLPIPQDALAKMPPDQRAKFEEAMKARAGRVNTNTSRTCVTKDDLDRGDLLKSERENCTRKVINQTARHFEVEETCAAPEPSETHMTFDSKSPETYAATIERSQGEGGQVQVDLSGRWIEAKCAAEDED